MVAFVNNRFVDEKEASLGITDLSIQRGYGVFDFFRTGNNVPLFADEHLDRFERSAAILRLQPPCTREQIKNIMEEMNRRNQLPESSFRLVLTGGYSPDYYELSAPNFIIIQQPLQLAGMDAFEKGIKIILHEYLRDLPEAKSTNYLMGVYLQQKIKEQHADEMLYCNADCILEFPRANVFAVTKDGTVITPAKNVLHGITRMKVLELARDQFAVEERDIMVAELKNAAEIFLTSTTKRVLPVVFVDGVQTGNGKPGPVTTALYKAFMKMEKSLLKAEVV